MTARTSAGVAVWVAVVGIAVAWGAAAVADAGLAVDAAPLTGRWRWHASPALAPAVALAAAAVAAGPRLTARLPWRTLVAFASAAAVAWAVALAAADGWDRLAAPLATRYEYEPFAATVADAGHLLRTFTDGIDGYPTHVRGHPPFATLVPWALDRLGIPGAGWFAAVCIGAWGAATGAVLVALRAVAGEDAARRSAPAVAFAPGAVWAATSADALFAGAGAVAVAALVVACVRRTAALALAGGALFGAVTLLTYGAVALAAVPATVAWWRRSWGPLALGAAAAAAVVAGAGVTGFWWIDGLLATRAQYWEGVASRRPWPYFALAGNPAALALAVGPAVVAGLAARGAAATRVLPYAAAAAVAVANASLLSKGEVERVWLLFVPWLAAAAAALPAGRWWLAAQVGVGLALQAWLVSPW